MEGRARMKFIEARNGAFINLDDISKFEYEEYRDNKTKMGFSFFIHLKNRDKIELIYFKNILSDTEGNDYNYDEGNARETSRDILSTILWCQHKIITNAYLYEQICKSFFYDYTRKKIN